MFNVQLEFVRGREKSIEQIAFHAVGSETGSGTCHTECAEDVIVRLKNRGSDSMHSSGSLFEIERVPLVSNLRQGITQLLRICNRICPSCFLLEGLD